MAVYILLTIFYLTAPAAILFICRKNRIFNKIGPVLTLYLLGVIVANIGILPFADGSKTNGTQDPLLNFMESFSGALIPLALPMILFGCNFKKFSLRKSLKAFATGAFAIVAFVVIGYLIFKKRLGDEGNIMGASLTGQYLGGSANLGALKEMLDLSKNNFIILSTCNLIVSFFYLMFLMGGGVRLARLIVGKHGNKDQTVNIEEYVEENPYREFGTKKTLKQLGKVLVAAVAVMGVSVCIGKIAGDGDEISMTALILSITTLSLLLTTRKEVRSWDKSYDAGMYLIYVFCLVMATMADLGSDDWSKSLYILQYQAVIIFGSLFLTILLAKLVRIDADTAVITSNTLINSPLCVPMIAATMKNKDVIMTGIANGLLGYALGNYIGYMMFNLL